MEAKVSGNCIRNIHKPCAPDKEINQKGNTVGKIAKGQQIRVYASLDTDLGEVSFHYVCFKTKEIAIFQVRFIAFPSMEFPKVCWTLTIFLPFLVPVNKKIRPSYNISNSEETAFLNLFFLGF